MHIPLRLFGLLLALGAEDQGLIFLEDVCSEEPMRIDASIKLKEDRAAWLRKA